MWDAIAYVSSGLTLAAFLAAAATWILKAKSDEKVKLIGSATDNNRAKLVQDAMEFFYVDTTKLTKDQQYNIALEQILSRANRYKQITVLIGILAIIAATLSAYALSLSTISNNVYEKRKNSNTTSNDLNSVPKYTSKGIASISHQCNPETEIPCPPKSELTRRAIEVAKISALNDISKRYGVSVQSLTGIMMGRMRNEKVITKSGNVLYVTSIKEPIITGDHVSIKIIVEFN